MVNRPDLHLYNLVEVIWQVDTLLSFSNPINLLLQHDAFRLSIFHQDKGLSGMINLLHSPILYVL